MFRRSMPALPLLTLSLFALIFVFAPIAAYAQASATTIYGCLNKGDRPDFYTLKEEGTGFQITVTGANDLETYSSNQEVRLRGSMDRVEDRDVFRASSATRLSNTCQPAQLSAEGFKAAVGRATFGFRGGIGFDPELIYLGAQAQIGPVIRNLWFRPNYEFGFGEVTKINSLNLEFTYHLPLTARAGSTTDRNDLYTIYVGAGPALHLSHRHFDAEREGEADIDFGDWDFDSGLNFLMGISKRNGFFAELKSGTFGSPAMKAILGFNFRR